MGFNNESSADRTIEVTPRDGRTSFRVSLRIVSGPHRGQQWVFDRPTRLTIGRGAPANVRLPSESALSKTHCELWIDPPTFRLVDLSSTNGTLVNGVGVVEAMLTHGDEVTVGKTTLQIELGQSSGSSPSQRLSEHHASTSGDKQRANSDRTRVAVPSRDVIDRVVQRDEKPSPPTMSLSPNTAPARPLGSLPQTFGVYELGEKLGEGGMAVVYAARHRKTSQQVAIKVICFSLAPSEKSMQLFIREASLMLQLKHPRIVRCLELGFQDQQPFLVLERIPAIDLVGMVDGKPLVQKVRIACWVVSRVLQAIGYAHSKGIVHRDVKPGNILAYRDGRHLQVKLADFGLAKCYEDAGFSAMTDDHSMRGTLAYMAPEQMRDACLVGPPVDIFAAGACLYRLISGEYPDVSANGAKCEEDFLRELKIPKALIEVIARAMQPDPNDRFSDALSMERALQPFHGKS